MSRPPRVDFRCDAGARHGLGHLSRCLGIARAMNEIGYQARFVCEAPVAIRERVIGEGHELVAVTAHTGADDPDEWLRNCPDVLVVDSKEMGAQYIGNLALRTPVVCFDDEVARNLPCHAVINNNLWANATDYQAREGKVLWLGPRYNTVNPAYFSLARRERKGVLLSLGGEDPHDHTSWLIEALAAQLQSLPVHVCVGPAHPAPENVVSICRSLLPSALIYRAPTSLLEPVAQCAVALSAGGTTCYELAAAGVAMAILAVEDHQEIMLNAMASRGAALSLGTYSTLDKPHTLEVMGSLCHADTVRTIAATARGLFDAPGAGAIAREIDNLVHDNA